METPTLERRLAAILAADIEGYSRLMGIDETATLETLSSFRQITDNLIADFEGRIANTAGDSVLAEFSTVMNAVRCAVAIQEAIGVANDALTEERRMQFRIGINLGDVMVKDSDIFGDGVNIAARLESLAETGGICISRGVRDSIRGKVPYVIEDVGVQAVKNIEHPIRAYRIRYKEVAVAPSDAAAAPDSASHEPALTSAENQQIELAFWESIKDSAEIDDFEAYLMQFPQGSFMQLAQNRLESLRAATPEANRQDAEASEVEMAFWDSIKNSESTSDYEAYLKQFPHGSFALLARTRAASLAERAAAAPKAEPASAADDNAVEIAFWNSIKDDENPATFEAYLSRFPGGAFAELARIRRQELGPRRT